MPPFVPRGNACLVGPVAGARGGLTTRDPPPSPSVRRPQTTTLSHYCWDHRHEFAHTVGPGWASRVALQEELAKTQSLRETDARRLAQLEAERLLQAAADAAKIEKRAAYDALMTA